MDHVKTTVMSFTMRDNTRTTHVATSGNEDDVTRVELDEVRDFVLLQVELDRVVCLDERVRVPDCAAVVSNDVRHALCSNGGTENLAKLVGSLFGCDAVDRETALNVVQKTEMLPRLFDRDDIHKTGRVSLIGTDAVVNLDETLLDNSGHLAARERVFQTIAQENGEGERFPELVRARRRTRSLARLCTLSKRASLRQANKTHVSSAQLVQHP